MALKGLLFNDKININYNQEYILEAKKQGKDKPTFYVAMVPNYFPDDMNTLIFPERIDQAKALLHETKDWPKIRALYTHIDQVIYDQQIQAKTSNALNKVIHAKSLFALQKEIDQLDQDTLLSISTLQKHTAALTPKSGLFYPVIRMHGLDNQFHQTISRILKGDFGKSKLDGRPTIQVILKALPWTFVMVMISILISMSMGIGLGIVMVLNNNRWLERVLSTLLYMIYAVPVFWLATILVVFFTTDDYGRWTNIFPSLGINPVQIGMSNLEIVFANLNRLWLPIFCISIHSLAYLSRQMRSSLLDEMGKSYFLTAMAKGLSKKQAIFRHALPNAMIPIVTIFVGMIPSSFAGSVVLEVIFNIPGMGRILFDAITNYDWSIISALLILLSVVTLISYLLGDVLYSLLNPKINLSKSR